MAQTGDITCLCRNALGIMGREEVTIAGRLSRSSIEQVGKLRLWKGTWLTQEQSNLSNRPGPPVEGKALFSPTKGDSTRHLSQSLLAHLILLVECSQHPPKERYAGQR